MSTARLRSVCSLLLLAVVALTFGPLSAADTAKGEKTATARPIDMKNGTSGVLFQDELFAVCTADCGDGTGWECSGANVYCEDGVGCIASGGGGTAIGLCNAN